MPAEIKPLRDLAELRSYIGSHWQAGHVLARSSPMAEFTYGTPWVDPAVFPSGYSVLGAYDGKRLVGFIGAIAAPYPRPRSLWLALWHVLPELKGTGMGGRLLAAMQDIALDSNGWVGTFGAGPDALPVYLSRGYAVRGVRRWVYDPSAVHEPMRRTEPNPSVREVGPNAAWCEHRFGRHPFFRYQYEGSCVYREELNEWGHVTHIVWMPSHAESESEAIFRRGRSRAGTDPFLLDAWSVMRPGACWRLAEPDLPSVFHPPEARGNRIYAVGLPFLPDRVHKGDCDQDRPN